MAANNTFIAKVFKEKKQELAEVFANGLYLSDRWKDTLDKAKANWDEFVEEEFFAYCDYWILYYESNKEEYKHLFLGEKLKSLYDFELTLEESRSLANKIHTFEVQSFEKILKPDLGSDWHVFLKDFNEINDLIVADAKHNVKLLFVGDCLFLDILSFIVAPLMQDGISVSVDYVTSKNAIESRERLRKLSEKKYDLVFFSPFTYDFSLGTRFVNDWKTPLLGQKEMEKQLQLAWKETQATVELIADLYDCSLYVHNASFLIANDNAIRRYFKSMLTSFKRNYSKNWIHEKLQTLIKKINENTFQHVFLIDENNLLSSVSELTAGSYLYNSKLQHPLVAGMIFAKSYTDIIYSNVILKKKKLVISDLDNTLWKGVIGEGAVTHHHDRQALLKALKAKGIVLGINSKNDPKNVHWTDATLSKDDFVYEAISWNPKVQAIKNMHEELNLKTNSFVFIDDREDELDLMRTHYPEIVSLDANEENTWKRLNAWLYSLEDDLEMDRTLMYQQREKRKAFVKEDISSEAEKTSIFASLNLSLTIKRPDAGELKRTTELINRTNQFNLEGTRVTQKEMTEWFANKDYLILCGRTSDRFGDMGVTCVAVAQLIGQDVKIIAFVLSCRVFGYQFEHSVMNYIKRAALTLGASKVIAQYTPTAQNAPCSDFLSQCGFVKSDSGWHFDLSKEMMPDAPWLTVNV